MSNQAPRQAQNDELIGRVINDRFRIVAVIARGGMGRVYRAEQVPLGRLVAVKTLDPRHVGGDQDPQFQQRFFLEASVASKLQHPNTVTVFDYGRTADGIYFIAMELVEGRSLLSLVREEAPLSAPRVVHIALQIARSLREAHRLDVIHRDLKPGNVLLTRHGDEEDFVKVLDFGLVKHVESEDDQELTKAGLFMGSPKYMSPEQIRGERVDARSDIYALGVVMYEMLTGRVPFDRENTVKVLMAHMHEAVPPIENPECPPALADLVMRCLSKHPNARPSSMDDVILQLKQATGAVPLMSGQYQLSQEIRLHGSPTISGRTLVGAPPSGLSGAHPLPALTPTGGFSGSWAQPAQVGMSPAAGVPSQVTPAAAPQSGWLPKAAVIGALAIAGGFLALRFTERAAIVTEAPVQPSPAAAAPSEVDPQDLANQQPAPAADPSAPDAPSEPAQHHVIVSVSSVPAGATVSIDGKVYGETPANIEWWGELAQPGREVTFTLQKEGYEKVTVVRSITAESLTIESALPRVAPVRRRSEPRTPRAPVVLPDDFKNDPY
jgi:serine/threonine-protein kinase